MSAPPSRGQRGGSTAGGSRGAPAAPRNRGSSRGLSNNSRRGSGRGRSGPATSAPGSAPGILQQLRTGTLNKTAGDGTMPRGRGRGAAQGSGPAPRAQTKRNLSVTFNEAAKSSASAADSRPSSPAPSSIRDFMNQIDAKFESLKQKREVERANAIRDGFLADPEKKTTLDKAITPVGTCTDMCPQFERVERIKQNMVDRAEKTPNEATGQNMPSESQMVKRFRRSAAGYDEQLPSDIRTPSTLRMTLDYLLDTIIGGSERLAVIHKFVWDRTRGIRNDFSIQQLTKHDDVKIAVECYERIARFHIIALHQLSNPANLLEGENFDAHQEREQLNNTLLSLMYYYDDNRHTMSFPNEAEFRSYCIIFEIQSQHPDLEDRMQSWPSELLNDKRIQTAFRLYSAASNTLQDQGPLRPLTPFAMAQANSASFWSILSSRAVPYALACIAEIYFNHVRFTALDAIWRSGKSAPTAHQARSRDWTLDELTKFLGFDLDEQTLDYCAAFDLSLATTETGEQYLDFSALSTTSLDKSSIPSQQVFSYEYVEAKRFRRTLVAVINGVSVSQAIKDGFVVADEEQEQEQEDSRDDEESLFVPEKLSGTTVTPDAPVNAAQPWGSKLNPLAPTFTGKFGELSSPKTPERVAFGQPAAINTSTGNVQSIFGTSFDKPSSQESRIPETANARQDPNLGTSISFSGFGRQPAIATTTTQPATPQVPVFGLKFEQSLESPSAASSTVFGGFQGLQLSSTVPSADESTAQTPLFPLTSNPAPSTTQQTQTQPLPAFSFTPSVPSLDTTSTPEAPFTAPVPASLGSGSQSNLATGIGFQPPNPSTGPQPPVLPFPPSLPATITSPIPAAVPSGPSFSFSKVPLSAEARSDSPKAPFDFSVPTKHQIHSEQSVKQTSSTPAGSPRTQPSSYFPSSRANSVPKTQTSFPSLPAFSSSNKQEGANRITSPSLSGQKSSTVTPPVPSLPQSPSPKADRSNLVDPLAQLALLQPGGLMHELLEFMLPGILKAVIRQHQEEKHEASVAAVRTKFLSRKFGSLWRSIAWKRNLNRRAKQRRQRLTEAMRAEEKQKRNEEELMAILQAAKEKEQIQAEQKKAAEIQEAQQLRQYRIAKEILAKDQLAGTKRKSISESQPALAGTSAAHGPQNTHKRSRIISTKSDPVFTSKSMDPPPSDLRKSLPANPRISIFSGKPSAFGRSNSSSTIRPKLDDTHTDYFRLKALGLDPETPIVPLTKKQIEIKTKRKEEERKAYLEKQYRRPGSLAASKTPPPPTQVEKASSPLLQSLQPSPVSVSLASTPVPEDDDFLKELRKARETMANDTKWFKEQSAVLEKEIIEEEDLRKSMSSSRSTPRTSMNGLPMANGYEYYPADPKTGRALSRTEMRIRATGAHGLANKPIGGGPRYLPVAMSKKSALKYNSMITDESVDVGVNGSAKKKRRHKEVDRTFKPSTDDEDEEDDYLESDHSRKRAGGVRNALPPTRSTPAVGPKAARNPFELLQSMEEDEEEFPAEDDEEEEYPEDNDSRYHRDNTGIDGDTEDYGEEDEELLEDDDEEEEYEEESYQGTAEDQADYEEDDYPPSYHQKGQYASRDMSRASSAPGASADDAVVLSD